MNKELTKEEYKKLVTDIAVKISPIVIKKGKDSVNDALVIAQYAIDIADAVSDKLTK